MPWHLLTWNDFQGSPQPDHTAMTSVDISFIATDLGDGHVIFDSAIVEFHPEKSFTNTKDLYVLNHEQGHLNICLLQCRYINNLSHIHHIHYTEAQYDAMVSEVTRRWHKQDDRYDQETNHSINHEAQAKWDKFIADELNK